MKKLCLISLVIALVIALVGGLSLTSCGPEEVTPDQCQIDKEKAEKDAKEYRKSAKGIRRTGYVASAGGIVLCLFPATCPGGIAAELIEIGSHVLADELDELAEEADKIAEDPPSEYKEVFQIRPRTLDPWFPEPTTSFDFASINFANSTLRAIEATEALTFSLERASTAYAAGELCYYRLQIEAVLDYTTMLIADLTGLASSSTEFYEEWVTWVEETWEIVLTPEDIESYQQKIATEGFSEWELQALKEGLLATDEDIEWIKSEILSVDPVAEWSEIESALPGLDDVISSTLPAFTDLASEAERILEECPCLP